MPISFKTYSKHIMILTLCIAQSNPIVKLNPFVTVTYRHSTNKSDYSRGERNDISRWKQFLRKLTNPVKTSKLKISLQIY